MLEKPNIRVRPFRDSDGELDAVQRLVFDSAKTGQESPLRGAMNIVLVHPASIAGYGIMLANIVFLGPRSPLAAIAIAATVVTAYVYQYKCLAASFMNMLEEAMATDLGDISKYYQSGSPGMGRAREFWVAEVESQSDPGVWDLAGCIALGKSPMSPFNKWLLTLVHVEHLNQDLNGHIRRMFVSCPHRKKGIATLLLNALLEHAKSHGLASLDLGTTESQPAAMAFYEKQGFKRSNLPSRLGTGIVKMDVWVYSMTL